MPTILGHPAVAAAVEPIAGARNRVALFAVAALCSILPDADVVAFPLGIPYGHPFGHRGFSHSILFAAIVALVASLAFRARDEGARIGRLFAIFFVVTASHGLLDAMTTGGRGIAFFAPFDNRRFFLPWRPIPVSPIGAGALSMRGLAVVMREVFLLWVPAIGVNAALRWRLRRRSDLG